MREQLENEVNIANSFEKAIITSKITPNITYWTKVYLKDIPNDNDLSEFLLQMLENSKKFTTNEISSRVFTIEEDSISPFIKLEVTFSNGGRSSGEFHVPFNATIEDYIGIR